MKTLITSFGPFGVFESNPSHELMLMLQEDKEFSRRYNVLYDVIEVSYEAVDTWVNADNAVYDLIIHMGVASGSSLLRFETLARNAVHSEDQRL
jgi:pyrrolidone-carboxylate peptidase